MTEQLIGPDEVAKVRPRSEALQGGIHNLCPGCGEGIAVRVIANVIEEMGIQADAILVNGVGCYGQATFMIKVDSIGALHGRAPAMATGLRRTRPDPVIFTVQGDGDLFAEGVLEAVQAATRGENITIICVNNGVNGMTGSQMTPATVLGQRTNTTLDGRDAKTHGYPLLMAELLAAMPGSAYVARSAVHNPAEIRRAARYIKTAFEIQRQRIGLTYVELLTMCPSGWHMTPVESLDFIEDEMSKTHTLGVVKDITAN